MSKSDKRDKKITKIAQGRKKPQKKIILDSRFRQSAWSRNGKIYLDGNGNDKK